MRFLLLLFIPALFFGISCRSVPIGPAGPDLAQTNLLITLVPSSLPVDSTQDVQISLKNQGTNTIVFPQGAIFKFLFPVGNGAGSFVPSEQDLEPTSNNNAWNASNSGGVHPDTSTISLTALSQYSLAKDAVINITLTGVKPTTQGKGGIVIDTTRMGTSFSYGPDTLVFTKTLPHVEILYFKALTPTIVTDNQAVKLGWKTSEADQVMLNGSQVNPSDTLSKTPPPRSTPYSYPYQLKAIKAEDSTQKEVSVYVKSPGWAITDTISYLNLWADTLGTGARKTVGQGLYKVVPARHPDTKDSLHFSVDGIDKWTILDTVPREMASSPVAVLSNQCFLVGGSSILPDQLSNQIYSYNPSLKQWNEPDTAPWSPRMGHSVVVYPEGPNAQIWVMGGINEYGNPLNDVWYYEGGNWQESTDTIPWSARGIASATVYDGEIWLGPGFHSYAGKPITDFWTFDGSTWQEQTLKPPRGPFAASSLQTLYQEDRKGLFFIGVPILGGFNTYLWLIKKDGNDWTLGTPRDGQTNIPDPLRIQCYSIQTTTYNGVLWFRSLDYLLSGTGLNYFVPSLLDLSK